MCLGLWACGHSPADSDKAVVGIKTDGSSVADIIRNPVSARSEHIDTTRLARLTFTTDRYNFGEVDAGAVITHIFTFTNTGSVPLVISDVRTTCGCTVADYPRDPIPPGGSGEIEAKFDTKNKTGRQSKPITITANTYPAKTHIYLDGYVYGEDEG
ncbi:MAG: DUF1573 domain-containing protein [Bacteroidetes bacterium]|nr:MAG: DUF1573 domain-containing protein [Bacteroidota bacterium]